jgi:hypothetical protein
MPFTGEPSADDVAGQGDLQRVAMAVQVAALAGVVGNAVARVEFQAARDTHGNTGWQKGPVLYAASFQPGPAA